MKVKVLGAEALNFVDKGTGELVKINRLWVCSTTSEQTYQSSGAFYIGHRIDKINLHESSGITKEMMIDYVGKDVELVYEQQLGRKYPTLVDIKVLS